MIRDVLHFCILIIECELIMSLSLSQTHKQTQRYTQTCKYIYKHTYLFFCAFCMDNEFLPDLLRTQTSLWQSHQSFHLLPSLENKKHNFFIYLLSGFPATTVWCQSLCIRVGPFFNKVSSSSLCLWPETHNSVCSIRVDHVTLQQSPFLSDTLSTFNSRHSAYSHLGLHPVLACDELCSATWHPGNTFD